MRKPWICAAVAASFAIALAGAAAAQQQDPNLNPEDQLAPSQMTAADAGPRSESGQRLR